MRHVPLFAALPILAACSEKTEQTYTVDELVAGGALISLIVTGCQNNPGELSETANCRNTAAADGKLRLQNLSRAFGG